MAEPSAVSLRIAVIATPFYEVPPASYGGSELVCWALVETLVERGHDVTLVHAGAADSRARSIVTFENPPAEGIDDVSIETFHVLRAMQELEALELDVVHDHTRVGVLTAFDRDAPTVVTVHGAVAAGDPYADVIRVSGERVSFVAVSETQRRSASLPWTGVVLNGIRTEEYPFEVEKDAYVLFLGRLSADKGVHLAIQAARAAGQELVIAGSWTVPSERAYLREQIAPMLGNGVRWVGAVGGAEKMRLLSRARCLLFPCQWNEPFGLTVAEALACGTPVVGLRAGAIPELVEDGRTGVICDEAAGLPEAIEAAEHIDPFECRAAATTRFGAERMVNGYERIYRRVVEANRMRPPKRH